MNFALRLLYRWGNRPPPPPVYTGCLRAGQDVSGEDNLFCPCRVSSSGLSFVQSVVAIIPNEPSGKEPKLKSDYRLSCLLSLQPWYIVVYVNSRQSLRSYIHYWPFVRVSSSHRYCEQIKCYPRRPERFARAPYISIHKKSPTICNNVSKCFIIAYLYEAQHVSGDTPPIIRSLKLHWQHLVFHTWKVVGRVVGGCCQAQNQMLPVQF